MTEFKLSLRASTGIGFLVGLMLGLGQAAVVHAETPPMEVVSLATALDALRDRGLPIIYTTNLVRDEMRAAGWRSPTRTGAGTRDLALRTALDTLLAPHGLGVREGAGGRLVVVRQSTPDQALVVAGVVRDPAGAAVAGATVQIVRPSAQASTDARGRFHLADVSITQDATPLLDIEITRPGFVPSRFQAEMTGRPLVFDVTLVPDHVMLDEIVVTPSRVKLLADQPSMLALDRTSLDALPQLGNDPLRALSVFPGTATTERSAGLRVRGGRDDEVMVVLDGLEIVQPFHLREFDNALSIVAPGTVHDVELMTGAFPAEYGDRLSGVLSLTTTPVTGTRRVELGLSAIDVHALGAQTWRGDTRILGSVRLGSLAPAFEVAGDEENPRFSDFFGKVARAVDERQDLRLQVLLSNDDLDFVEKEDTREDRIRSRSSNAYLWANHQAMVGGHWLIESLASASRLTQDRQSRALDGNGARALTDDRRVRIFSLRQGWSRSFGDRHALRWGFEARDLTADYAFSDDRQIRGPVAEVLGTDARGVGQFDQTFRGQQYAFHVSERWRPRPSLTLDLGLRFDESALADDEFVSPRVSAAWSLAPSTTVRAAWGHFHQSHRPNELRIEDGETTFQPAERATHRVIGVDHRFDRGLGWAARLGLRLRIELYDREINQPRPRYENLFEPFSLVPELEPDRILLTPARSRAQGIEILLRGRQGARVGWLISYTRSRAQDRLETEWVRRGIDQPNAITAVVDMTLVWGVRLHAAWRFHSGWPTTDTVARRMDYVNGARAGITLGPLFGDRLPDYHRLDLRLSRTWRVGNGALESFVEVQNAYGRRNVLGFEIDTSLSAAGEAMVARTPILGSQALPWAGVVWRF